MAKPKTVFQRMSDFILRPTPKWILELLDSVWDMTKLFLSEMGRQAIADLQRLIMEAGNRPDLSGTEKAKWVYDNFWKEWNLSIVINDRTFNFLRELFYSLLRKKGLVRGTGTENV